ncbi:reverse transcriptase domain-containing protein [Tanacetum coccineum]
MSAMADITPVIATVKNTGAKEKTSKETDAMPKASILNFCDEHYEDILPIIMDRARHDKRKEPACKAPPHAREAQDTQPGKERRQSVFSRLGHRKKSAFERLSDTYSPSTTKSGPSRASSRDHFHDKGHHRSRDRPSSRNHPRVRDRLRGAEESYGDTHSSHGTRTKYRDRSYDEDSSRSMKKMRVSESPSSRISVSSTSNRTHQKSRARRHGSTDEEDLAVPWTCEDVDPFTPRIRNFKTAAQVERWAMPTWCHMFNSTLIGAARVWFDELPPESIDGYNDLKAAFLAYFMQQKKYVKDPVEIHNIKQRDGETIEEFMKRFKIETGRMKGAPKCM